VDSGSIALLNKNSKPTILTISGNTAVSVNATSRGPLADAQLALATNIARPVPNEAEIAFLEEWIQKFQLSKNPPAFSPESNPTESNVAKVLNSLEEQIEEAKKQVE
jgi:hypothetical protein